MTSPVVLDGRITEEKLTELLALGGEFPALDHKATLDMSSGGQRLGLAKDLIAMMNSGGGYVIVGTEDSGDPAHDAEPVNASRFDSADLAALVSKYVTTPPLITAQAHVVDGRAVVLIHVAPTATGLPAIVTRLGEEQLASGKKSHILEPGCIYVRQGTSNVAASDAHWAQMLERYRTNVMAESRQDIDILVKRVVESLVDRGDQGTRIPLAVEMEDATFAEAVEAHFGSNDRERRLRRYLRKLADLISLDNENEEEREAALTKVAIVAVQAVYADHASIFEAAVKTMHDAYTAAAVGGNVDYVPKTQARYWLSHLLRLFCIGAVVEREEAWWAVEPLVNRPVGDYYLTWLRHGLVHASRAELLSGGRGEGALVLILARDFAARHASLRDDLGEVAQLDEDADLPPADSMLDSLCRFDIRWCIVAAAANPGEREGKLFYPSCSALRQARAQPVLSQLAMDGAVRRKLLLKEEAWDLDTYIADAMRSVLQIAVAQSHHHSGSWWAGSEADLRVAEFIGKNATAQ